MFTITGVFNYWRKLCHFRFSHAVKYTRSANRNRNKTSVCLLYCLCQIIRHTTKFLHPPPHPSRFVMSTFHELGLFLSYITSQYKYTTYSSQLTPSASKADIDFLLSTSGVYNQSMWSIATLLIIRNWHVLHVQVLLIKATYAIGQQA